MDRIIVEGVRCFHDWQEVSLKPVTLLVGENSSGKTTFLALTRLAWDLCRGSALLDFNEEPFLLGSYEQISSYRGGRGGRVKSFTIGAQVTIGGRFRHGERLRGSSEGKFPDKATITGRFESEEAQPKMTEWVLDAAPFRMSVQYGDKKEQPPVLTITAPSGSVSRKVSSEFKPGLMESRFPNMVDLLRFTLFRTIRGKGGARIEGKIGQTEIRSLLELAYESFQSAGPRRPFAFAPIRTRPQRTYDLLKDIPRPEGSHVPMILAKTFSSDPAGWQHLRESLDSFGKTSGLFSDVEIRRMGQKESGPFQIRVKISGPPSNLVDVGYGVSQVLPIIVDALQEPKGTTFLLQQPEVHLHPRAQAALGSFLALLAKEQKKRFIIETHSDYLVDRIRMDIRDQKYLTPDDVSLLYFEREDGSVRILPLEIDPSGNIVNAPRGYRHFFLEEESRLLGG